MERRERPTVMDGKVVTFAESFSGKDEGMSLPTPEGPYRVSASRNAVVVHRAQIKSRADAEAVIEAIREAVKEAEYLTTQDWGGEFARAPLGKGR